MISCRLRAVACLVLGISGPAQANVVWDWSAGGGAHRGQIITNGTSLAAGSFTVLDVSFTSSTFMPVGSVSNGTYHMPVAAYGTAPPYTIVWNGSTVLSIDAASSSGVNGLIIGDDATNLVALFGTDSYGSHVPGDWEFQSADFTFQKGSDLSLTPEPPPNPEIAVEDSQHLNIADGGNQSFGSVRVGGDTSLTFTIKNVGTGDLTGLLVTITDSGAFSVTSQPTPLPVPGPNGTTTFTVRFAPSSSGAKSAALHIANNDADENPFDINLGGTGTVDCVVSAWSAWSPCCSGTQTRTRTVVTPDSSGGAACPPLSETRACATPNPVATISWPAAGLAYPVNVPVRFSAAFSDSSGGSHSGTWTIGGLSIPAAITEPVGGHAGSATASHAFTAIGAYPVQLVLVSSCGGADTASVSINVAVPDTFPQTAVLDDFNRPNGAVGGSWIDETSTYLVTSGALAQSGGQTYIEWNRASFGANQEAFVTLSAINPATVEHNLMLKTQGTTWSNGHIEVSYETSTSSVFVYTFTPPTVWKTIGSIPGVTFAPGDQFGARALSNGTVKVYRNGSLLGSVSVAGWPYAGLGGRIGLSAYDANLSRFDDFGGGDVLPSPLLGLPSAPPASLSLSSAFPNPTSGRVQLTLALPREDDVSLSVIDVQGREVWSIPTQRLFAGRWPLAWDGRTSRGPAGPGVYLAHVRVGSQSFLRRIAVVR